MPVLGGGGLDDFLTGVARGAGIEVTATVTEEGVSVASQEAPVIQPGVAVAPLLIAVLAGGLIVWLIRQQGGIR